MSIGITAKSTGAILNFNKLTAAIRPIANHAGFSFSCDNKDKSITLNFTDNGVVNITYQTEPDGKIIAIDSQTSVLGPGFHCLVVDLLDAITDLTEIEFEVEDDTQFYYERDFENMRTQHFCGWLKQIVQILKSKESGDHNNLMLNWELSWPIPCDIPGSVVTPFGRLNITGLLNSVDSEGIESLAERFFPCWEQKIDRARLAFYDALYMLWVKCSFCPSSRSDEDADINSRIIAGLETAIKAGLPIPHAEYLELCSLAGQTPANLDGIADLPSDYPIGFRKHPVRMKLGNVTFPIPGYYLFFDDEGSQGYWGGYDDSDVIRTFAVSLQPEQLKFIENEKDDVIETGEIPNGRYMLSYLGDDGDAQVAQVQVLSDEQFSLFTISSPTCHDKESVVELTRDFVAGLTAAQRDWARIIDEMTSEDRHAEVVDMLLKLPPEQLTDELKGQLARAYNNIGEYEKAIPLLLETQDTQQTTANWNFRLGYSHYYLGNYDESLRFFEKADKIEPDDDDTLWFISQCKIHNPFSERVKRFWDWFCSHSEELENLLATTPPDWHEKTSAIMSEGLALIGNNVFYNIGGHNELTFCVENHTEYYFLYPWLVDAMPESLKERWAVYPCKQPADTSQFRFVMYDKDVNVSEVMVKAIYDSDNNNFALSYHHPVLAQLDEPDSMNAFCVILELTIGEGAAHNYIANVQQADSPEGMYSIGELEGKMRAAVDFHEKEYSSTPLLPYCSYSCKPDEDEDRLRFDIVCGTTQYLALIEEYVSGERAIFDALASKGAEAMMLIIAQPESMDAKEFIDFRYKVEDRLDELFKSGALKGRLLGGAYGAMGLGYIDLLLYDGPAFSKYLNEEGVLDSLLKMDDGGICPVKVYCKDFTQGSGAFRIR